MLAFTRLLKRTARMLTNGRGWGNAAKNRKLVSRPTPNIFTQERHLPRILGLARTGLDFFRIGPPSLLCDWIYVVREKV